MDKEKLRRLFGEFGDASEALESIFGSSYLDYKDDSHEEIPEDLRRFSESSGGQIFNVTGLVERAFKAAPEITCEENQTVLVKHLRGFINGNPDSTFEEIRATTKHKEKCTNTPCRRIDYIATFDNRLSPDEMKATFGEEIENWEIE